MVDAAFVIRTGPSGPDMPQSTPGNVLTVQADGVSVAAEAPPSSMGLPIGQMVVNVAQAVTFDAQANNDSLRASIGSDFAYSGASEFTLSANGLLTYTGPDVWCLASLNLCWFCAMVLFQNADFATGIAHNGDLLGLTCFGDAQSTAGVCGINYGGISTPALLLSQRLVQLTSGDTLQVVMGQDSPGGRLDGDPTVQTLTLAVWFFKA
jgi:hypothetical protein